MSVAADARTVAALFVEPDGAYFGLVDGLLARVAELERRVGS